MILNKNAKLVIGISVAAGLAIAISMLLSAEKSKGFRRKISASLDDFGKKACELLEENKDFLLQKGGAGSASHSARQKFKTT
jgi:hypothetical protein